MLKFQDIPVYSRLPDQCPHCGNDTPTVHGTPINTPPFAIQMLDEELGVKREWSMQRYWCTQCQEFLDVILVNNILSVKKS